jgi:putative phosphoesterase
MACCGRKRSKLCADPIRLFMREMSDRLRFWKSWPLSLPLQLCAGNVDKAAWAQKLPETEVVEIGGISIYVLHDLAQLDLKPEASGFSVVISGHSHVPKQETRNGVLHFNPGSAGPRRFKLPVSVGRLIVENGAVRGEILQLSVDHP